jgi:predicted RNase H-like HicB family nuclease
MEVSDHVKSADEGDGERIGMETLYELRIQIEELDDGGDYRYLGTSPDLPNLVVVGDSVEEVVANAPGVARALLETMHEHGLPIPSLAEARQPYQTRVLVSA